MNCYPDVLDVIEAAKDVFYGSLSLNDERAAELEPVCALMDEVAAGYGAEFVDVEIDEGNGILSLSMEIPDMILRDRAHGFYELVENSAAFELIKLKGDMMRFSAYFDNLWSVV